MRRAVLSAVSSVISERSCDCHSSWSAGAGHRAAQGTSVGCEIASLLSFDQESRQLLQRFRALAESIQLRECIIDQLVCFADGGLDSKQRRIGCLLGSRVLAGGFSQLFGGLGDVENVVDDLKSQPDRPSKRAQPVHFAVFRASVQPAAYQAGRDQGRRL